MTRILIVLAALVGFTLPASASETTDPKATTIHLDSHSSICVWREGDEIRVKTLNAGRYDREVLVVGEVQMTGRQASRLTEVIDNAIGDIPQPRRNDKSVESRSHFNAFRLVGTDGYRYLAGVGMTNARPSYGAIETAYRPRSSPAYQCGPKGCTRIDSAAPYVPPAQGDSAGSGRRRVFGGGRFLGRRCCR